MRTKEPIKIPFSQIENFSNVWNEQKNKWCTKLGIGFLECFWKHTTNFHDMLFTAQLKRILKPHLEGHWTVAKSFSAFHQYFIRQGIEGQGMKGA